MIDAQQIPEAVWDADPFDTFDDEDRVAMLAISEVVEFEDGAEIYGPGTSGQAAFVLLGGSVELSYPDMDTARARSPVSFDTVGTFFSQGSLLDEFEHRHLCRAEGPTKVLRIGREAFQECFSAGEMFALRLLDHVVSEASAEIRELNTAIHSLLSDG